jgi:hypothetical protein
MKALTKQLKSLEELHRQELMTVSGREARRLSNIQKLERLELRICVEQACR